MAKKHIPLVVGNWKMNPLRSTEIGTIVQGAKAAAKKYQETNVVIAPPLIYTTMVAKLLARSQVALGVQHVHPSPLGAFTGEVSAFMCPQFGVTYAIVGHSERRAGGETNAHVSAQVMAALKAKLIPIICVGERERDSQANFFAEIEAQIVTALTGVPRSQYRQLVIAYEPIWAIGTGATATAADVQEMRLFVNKVLTKISDRTAAGSVRVLYGGSVNADNARTLFTEGGVGGFLVGGASLKPAEFAKIIASTITN